jgi:WD40 repeat protein
VITSSPDPKHQLEGVRRWLVDFDPHPQRAEALKLRAQVCLVVPVLSLTHPNTLCKKASIVKDKYALTHGGGVVVQWSLEDGREVNRWEPNACSAVSVAVHPKGKSFAVSGKGKTYLISLSGKKKPRLIYDKRTGTRLAWSPSGKMLALTGDNGRVAVLKLRKKKLWKLHRDYAHHRTPLLAVAFASETLMVSASGPSLDRKWKGGGGESASCAVVVVDVSRKDKKPLHRVDLDGPPMCLAVEGTKSYVVGCVNNHLRRYALQGDVPSHEFLGEGVEGAAHHGQVRGVSVSGNWIASTSGNDHLREHNELRIWDAKTGVELAHMLNRPFRLQSVQFAPDGRSLLVGGPGGAEYWDLGGLSAPD